MLLLFHAMGLLLRAQGPAVLKSYGDTSATVAATRDCFVNACEKLQVALTIAFVSP